MVVRARLVPPQQNQNEWPWHNVKCTTISTSVLSRKDRRMEAEAYLANGYGIRLVLEQRKLGLTTLKELATVWHPSRSKGIQVSSGFGVPFLGATQIFDINPIPRKWLSVDKTKQATELFAEEGSILVTCSGSVGRSIITHEAHKNKLISNDLLRVKPIEPKFHGWIYSFLRAPQTRAMMSASQYGHIIKHLEVSHLNGLPIPLLNDKNLEYFNQQVNEIINARNRAHKLIDEAHSKYEQAVSFIDSFESGDNGFLIDTKELFSERRRFEAFHHSPFVHKIRKYFKRGEYHTFVDAGYNAWLPTRFKRIPAEEGIELLDSSDIFEINPDITKRIADGSFGDIHSGRVKEGWLLLARSGQIYGLNGTLTMATKSHEGKVVSDHIIRITPNDKPIVPAGYIFIAYSHPILGRPIMKSLAYGSSIPEIDPSDVENLEIIRIGEKQENILANMAEEAIDLYDLADTIEKNVANEADNIISRFIAGDMSQVIL